MADITGWNKDHPSGSSDVKDGDDLIRSDKSKIQATFLEEHYFTDSAASAGEHKVGSARAYVGPASDVSTIRSGAIMVASDTTDLHYVGSEGAFAITEPWDKRPSVLTIGGGALAVPASDFTLDDTGSDDTEKVWITCLQRTTSLVASQVSLGVFFDGIPFVQISAFTSNSLIRPYTSCHSVSRQTAFVSIVTANGGVDSTTSYGFHVLSIGTISRASL